MPCLIDLTPQSASSSRFQPFTPDDYTLKPHRIDIWQYSLTEHWQSALALLHPDERLRAERYHFARHQRRFSIARGGLRTLLSRYLNIAPKACEFTENDYGKPAIRNTKDLQFNLSHSQDLALLAVGQGDEIGIDLEYFTARDLMGIAKLMFSHHEIQGLAQVPTASKSLSFFHIWTQKEALIKASGVGLSYPTQMFDVPHLPPSNALIDDPVHDKKRKILSFMPEPACCAALCCAPHITEFRYHSLLKDTDVCAE